MRENDPRGVAQCRRIDDRHALIGGFLHDRGEAPQQLPLALEFGAVGQRHDVDAAAVHDADADAIAPQRRGQLARERGRAFRQLRRAHQRRLKPEKAGGVHWLRRGGKRRQRKRQRGGGAFEVPQQVAGRVGVRRPHGEGDGAERTRAGAQRKRNDPGMLGVALGHRRDDHQGLGALDRRLGGCDQGGRQAALRRPFGGRLQSPVAGAPDDDDAPGNLVRPVAIGLQPTLDCRCGCGGHPEA